MLFHTFKFAFFLVATFSFFWFVLPKKTVFQNAFLILVSYIFYGFWDYRFLLLLSFSTALDFYTGLKIHTAKTDLTRKTWLWISISINLGLLGFFKYFNFFIEGFSSLLNLIGIDQNPAYIQIILPVGISFYTFHGISYVIDIYYKRFEPTKDILAYGLFVSFFPLLVAGPIERAGHLLPQLTRLRVFKYVDGIKGLKQILWGLFKKMVIADNCQVLVDYTFANHATLPASALVLGAVFFSFQIYCDFSGYSDIAIGVGNLFGISFLRNFSYPYFTKNIVDFWKSWHISLTSWFKDYVFIPLGGSRGTWLNKSRNVLIIFLISGLWHGANWTFVFWGLLNALFFLVYTSVNALNFRPITPPPSSSRNWLRLIGFTKVLLNFLLVTFLWIFFRSENLSAAFSYLNNLISPSIISNPFILPAYKYALLCLILIFFFVFIEWKGKKDSFAIENVFVGSTQLLRWIFYGFIIFLMAMYAQVASSPFIYFQF